MSAIGLVGGVTVKNILRTLRTFHPKYLGCWVDHRSSTPLHTEITDTWAPDPEVCKLLAKDVHIDLISLVCVNTIDCTDGRFAT